MSQRNQSYFVSCWNVGTTCSWSLGKKVPGSKRLVAGQVKRLVLSGVIPTIQQQREPFFCAFHTLSIKKSDNVKKLQCHKEIIYVLLECWNDALLEPWKESPWVRTTNHWASETAGPVWCHSNNPTTEKAFRAFQTLS